MVDRIFGAFFGGGGLLRVRALLAYALVGAVVYLSIEGTLDAQVLETLAVAAVAFYFGTRSSGA